MSELEVVKMTIYMCSDCFFFTLHILRVIDDIEYSLKEDFYDEDSQIKNLISLVFNMFVIEPFWSLPMIEK